MPEELKHIGTPEHSGRYPFGSGEHGYQRRETFGSGVAKLRKQGLTEKEVADGKGLSIAELRAKITTEKEANDKIDRAEALRLYEKQYSKAAIAKRMGISDHTVASLLNPIIEARKTKVETISKVLADHIAKGKYADVGLGVEGHLGVSGTKLNAAVIDLQKKGYVLHEIKYLQMGTKNYTTMKVLGPPGSTQKEVSKDRMNITPPFAYSEDGGETFQEPEPPKMISGNRVGIRYGEEGGKAQDGLIELRRGVGDISLGDSKYAQVRIGVDGTHYMKGMAVYSDNLPKGVDIMYNTNKKIGTPREDVFKPIKLNEDDLKMDPDLPFGSQTRERHYIDEHGNKQLSVLNIVNEEGDWKDWSKKLSSQFLSKQTPQLVKQQLDLTLASKKSEFETLKKLTNPAVKQKLMSGEGGFADDCDSAAEHLKAAGLPRTSNHVILPLVGIKENEIYAPAYRQGEKVVLIRHPHGGIFEIPELVVNNTVPSAINMMGRAKDAVGIHPKVASKLSGADFDGDTVLVIPNDKGQVIHKPAIQSLIDFDTKEGYTDKTLPKMSDHAKQLKMGEASNLITDMTIKGAGQDKIVRAVKYSMIVIDAQKHSLDYQKAYKDFNISALKEEYQGKTNGKLKGAATLISRAGSEIRIPDRKIGTKDPSTNTFKYTDPKTGAVLYRDTNQTYNKMVTKIKTMPDGTKAKVVVMLDGSMKEKSKLTKEDYSSGNIKTIPTVRTIKITRMANETDARKLSSGQRVENIYADYANELKALANSARKMGGEIKFAPQSKSAREIYAPQVKTLLSKLNTALMKKPLERRAQLVGINTLTLKKQRNPDWSPDRIKKERGLQLDRARKRIGLERYKVDITDKEWEAIQSGAVSKNILMQILSNADTEALKQRAMPRDSVLMTPSNIARAQSMTANGYTQSEIADALGVSESTLYKSLN